MKNIINRFFLKAKRFLTLSNSLLLLFLFFTIFIIPFFSNDIHKSLYGTCYVIIFILSALSVKYVQKRVALFAIAVIIIHLISVILNMPTLFKIALPINFLFFLFIVGMLITGIARAENVTLLVILESISGYLLLGLCLSIMVALFVLFDPYSFNFQNLNNNITPNINHTSDYIYYTFVSLTSTGYGDFLPLTPSAKSLANLISISGQLYIAIIIAMIVGKYLNKR